MLGTLPIANNSDGLHSWSVVWFMEPFSIHNSSLELQYLTLKNTVIFSSSLPVFLPSPDLPLMPAMSVPAGRMGTKE